MKMVLIRKSLVLMITILFLVTSIVPVNSFSMALESTESEVNTIGDPPSFPMSYDLVHNPDIGEGLGERWQYMREYSFPESLEGNIDRELYDNYPWHYDEYLRNDSEYINDEPFFDYPDYEEFKDIHRYRYDEIEKSHNPENRKPTPKPNFAAGKTWYVDDDGGADFTKIQDAIDAASDGDTVYVYSGIYYENVVVNKSIILQGDDKDSTIIDGDEGGNVVYVSVDLVNLSGFTIQNSKLGEVSYAGIHISSNYNSISDNIISKNRDGIYSYYSRNNTISNNIISNNTDGLVLCHFSNSIIEANIIENNKDEGIDLEDSSGNIVKLNNIKNNSGYGIFFWKSSDNTIADNSFLNDGLWIRHSYHNIVTNNTVNDKPLVYMEDIKDIILNIEAGQIILVDCDKIIIKNQYISNTDIGIHLYHAHNCIISSNNILSNYIGLLIEGSNNIISSNNIRSSNFFGIGLSWDSSLNNITCNNILNNYFGIGLAGKNTIYGNNISLNIGGIILQQSDYNTTIRSNTISNNEYYGISSWCSSHISISSNTITNNNRGIILDNSYSNNITGNIFLKNGLFVIPHKDFPFQDTVFDNTVNGKPLVYLEAKSDIIVDDAGEIILIQCDNITIQNQVVSNATIGILLYDTDNCVISKNTVSYNYMGIILWYSNNNSIFDNIISNSFSNPVYYGIDNHGILLDISNDNIVLNNNLSNYNNGIFIQGSFDNRIIDNCCISNRVDGIRIIQSYDNIISNCTIYSNFEQGISVGGSHDNVISDSIIKNHEYGSGIRLVESNGTTIQNCHISNNMRGGIKLNPLSTSTNITSCLLTHNSWGIDLTTSESNRIRGCTIVNNIYGGIHRGQNNTITKNNFINNNIFNHYYGYVGDKNVFYRNYWSGRIPLPIPYLVHWSSKRIQSPFPHLKFTFNWDWFPKTIPYDYPTFNETLVDDSDGYSFDSVKSMVWNEDLNDQNSRFNLGDGVSDRLSSLFSKVYNVLNQDHRHLLNRWRDGR